MNQDTLRSAGLLPTLLLTALFLAGCAGMASTESADSERFEAGREAWLAGDYGQAFELLLTEAEGGNAEAQYTIGYMYYVGQGVQQDEAAAIRWIQRAAGNGSERAMRALGELATIGARYQSRMPEDAPDTDAEEIFD